MLDGYVDRQQGRHKLFVLIDHDGTGLVRYDHPPFLSPVAPEPRLGAATETSQELPKRV